MMRVVSSVVGSAFFLCASLSITSASSELRGSVSSSPSVVVGDDKPTIGLYTNGADIISQIILGAVMLPAFSHNVDCLDNFHIEITQYGMTEEKNGEFHLENALGGAQNVEYLKAMQCLQTMSTEKMTKAGATDWDIAESLVLWNLFTTSWEEIKSILDPQAIKVVQKCLDTKGSKLLHEAGEKTKSHVVYDFRNTLNMAVTINGKQDKDIWKTSIDKKLCEWSGKKDVCCHQKPEDNTDNIFSKVLQSSLSSSSAGFTPTEHHKNLFAKVLSYVADMAKEDIKKEE